MHPSVTDSMITLVRTGTNNTSCFIFGTICTSKYVNFSTTLNYNLSEVCFLATHLKVTEGSVKIETSRKVVALNLVFLNIHDMINQ